MSQASGSTPYVDLTVPGCTPARLTTSGLRDADADLIVVTVGTGGSAELLLGADAAAVDDGTLLERLRLTGFTGAWQQTQQVQLAAMPCPLLVVGTGPAPSPASDLLVTLREHHHALAGAVISVRGGRVAVSAGGTWDHQLIDAVVLATYRYDRYSPRPRPAELIVTNVGVLDDSAAEETASRLSAVCFARDWVTTPPGDKRPDDSQWMLLEQAEQAGAHVRIWDAEELAAAGCGGILAVGQGSMQPARIVQLTAPGTTDAPPVVLVGKGLTYDAGGVNLKTVWLEHLKLDVGGAAAVAGAVLHAARRPRRRTVHAWLAIAENLLSATSYLAGDVLRMHDGTTVEVGNTDAEGRIALADTMSLAHQTTLEAGQPPAALLTVATLTGAAIRALGPRTGIYLSSDAQLAATLSDAFAAAGESACRFPQLPHYSDTLRSHIADTNNIGGPDGATSVASAFLHRFAPPGVPFAHIDLAGPAFNMGEPYDGIPAGGTGYGVRSLINLIDFV